MKPWIFMIFTYLSIQTFGIYSSILVFDSVKEAFDKFGNDRITDIK